MLHFPPHSPQIPWKVTDKLSPHDSLKHFTEGEGYSAKGYNKSSGDLESRLTESTRLLLILPSLSSHPPPPFFPLSGPFLHCWVTNVFGETRNHTHPSVMNARDTVTSLWIISYLKNHNKPQFTRLPIQNMRREDWSRCIKPAARPLYMWICTFVRISWSLTRL